MQVNKLDKEIKEKGVDSVYTNFLMSANTPESVTPCFKPVRNKEYVPCLTLEGEQYPDMLLQLFKDSALHGAILRSKIDQVTGNGFIYDENDSLVTEDFTNFLKNANADGEDLNDIENKTANDLEIFNGFALLVHWSKDWTKVIGLEHIDYSKIRAGKVDDLGKITEYWWSWDWTNQKSNKYAIPAYNVATAKENKDAYAKALESSEISDLEKEFSKPNTQIYVYKPYQSGEFYYSIPSYSGALSSIKTDILSDSYGLSSFENGLNSDIIVDLPGYSTAEQKIDAAKKFLKMHTGAKKARKPIITFSEGADSRVEVSKINASKEDGIFTSINENTLQKILSSHRVTDPIIVGIKIASNSFSSEQVRDSIDFWNNTVIIPEQKEIAKVFNKILSINNFPTLEIEPIELITDNTEETQMEDSSTNQII